LVTALRGATQHHHGDDPEQPGDGYECEQHEASIGNRRRMLER